MEKHVRLSLSEAERGRLAELGVTADSRGVLHSASGREVPAGTAAAMLKAVQPGDFQRGPLRTGHAAYRAGDWTENVPPHASPVNRDGPETMDPARFSRGPLADGHAADHARVVGGVPAPGTVQGAAEKAGTPDPESFRRPCLEAGHEWDSPANTGERWPSHIPPSHPVAARDYRRGALAEDHAAPSPGDRGPNSHARPGAPGAVVYDSAAAAYSANRERSASQHVSQTGSIESFPAVTRRALPGGMRAESIPHPVTPAATRPAPGEKR